MAKIACGSFKIGKFLWSCLESVHQIQSVDLTSCAKSIWRWNKSIKKGLTTSTALMKRDKFALNLGKQRITGSRKHRSDKGRNKSPSIFLLGNNQFWNSRNPAVETAKMAMISHALHDAIACLLSSPQAPPAVQKLPIDIIKVMMSKSLNSATVFWNLDHGQENPELEAFVKDAMDFTQKHCDHRESTSTTQLLAQHVSHVQMQQQMLKCSLTTSVKQNEIESILQKHTEDLQTMLPAFHSMTNTPHIHFELNMMDRKEREVQQLLDKLKESNG